MAILDENRMFQDVFRELRTKKKLSQEKIATELDVSQSLINNWETNRSTPGPEMLDYIADYFKVSTDYLIGRTTDKRYYSSNEENKILNVLYDKLKDLSEEKQKFMLNVIKGVMEETDNMN